MKKFCLPWVATLGLFVVANAASYVVMSDGHGMPWVTVHDGIRRIGFPLLFWEQGGIDGRDEFYARPFLMDAILAITVSTIVPGLIAWMRYDRAS